jgi:N-acetylglucosaminyldiphosphoundecaprenol N-acetyl-beta-D-mannosaminyltransferase
MTQFARFHISGIRLDAAPRAEVIERIASWCRPRDGRAHTVCFVNAFSIVSAARDPEFARAINGADLSVVDGVPVAWVGRRLAGGPCERFSGPDLMDLMLTAPEHSDLRHFVFGGSTDALHRLEFRYNRGGTLNPRRILGTWAPPHRDLTIAEEADFISRLESLQPDILWVCLGTAKQEKWMERMRPRLKVPVIAGVGAAVDFLSGMKPRAPRLMQRAGLEWLFRLATEPRRLWRRYLLGNVVFLWLAGSKLWRRRGTPGESASTVAPREPGRGALEPRRIEREVDCVAELGDLVRLADRAEEPKQPEVGQDRVGGEPGRDDHAG